VIPLILTGGNGSRLYPYSESLSKVLFPVGSDNLLIRHLKVLKSWGYEKVLISVTKDFDAIRDIALGMELEVELITEFELKGSMHAVHRALQLYPEEDFIVVYGDVYFDDYAYSEFFGTCEVWKNDFDILIAVDKGRSTEDKSLVTLDDSNTVTSFLEKPEDINTSSFISSGLVAINNQVKCLVRECGDIASDLLAVATESDDITVAAVDIGSCTDIGTVKDYVSLQAQLRHKSLIKELKDIDLDEFYDLFDIIHSCEGAIYVIGNGGSMMNAMHAAVDMTKACRKKVISLSNVGLISAIANDFSYEESFSKQLESWKLTDKDVLLAFSSSGDSENIVNACNYAKSVGSKVAAITGLKGLSLNADVLVVIPTKFFTRHEDMTSILFHSLAVSMHSLLTLGEEDPL